jgi:ribosomal protein S27E
MIRAAIVRRPRTAAGRRDVMPGFWSGVWSGAMRTVACPHCGRKNTIARRPTPFDVTCKECGRRFRVTDRGVEAPRSR